MPEPRAPRRAAVLTPPPRQPAQGRARKIAWLVAIAIVLALLTAEAALCLAAPATYGGT